MSSNRVHPSSVYKCIGRARKLYLRKPKVVQQEQYDIDTLKIIKFLVKPWGFSYQKKLGYYKKRGRCRNG